MNLRNTFVVASVVTVAMIVVVVQAAEKKITRAQLPPAVEKTVAEQSRGATIEGFATEIEDGKKIYEVELTIDGRGRDISMDEQGNIIEVEEEVSLASLSQAVKEGLAKAAGTGTIGKVESLTKKGKLVAYEAVIQKGKKHTEVQVGPDGRKLAHPE
jgi:uncharacterized membrane protein YkoI